MTTPNKTPPKGQADMRFFLVRRPLPDSGEKVHVVHVVHVVRACVCVRVRVCACACVCVCEHCELVCTAKHAK